MGIKKLKINTRFQLQELIYYVAIMLFIFAWFMPYTYFFRDSENNLNEYASLFYRLVRYGAYFLCAVKIILFADYSKNWVSVVVLLTAILTTVMLMSDDTTVLYYFWIVAAAYGVSGKGIFRVAMYTQIALLVVTIVFALSGFLDNSAMGDRNRYHLGFTYVTYAPIFFFYIVLEYLYIHEMKVPLWQLLIIMAINVLLFVMTDTRYTFYLLTAVLVFVFIYNHSFFKRLHMNRVRYLLILMPEIIALAAILMYVFYNPSSSGWNWWDEFLSGRLYLGYNAIQEYGISLFGQQINFYGWFSATNMDVEYNYVDCSYLQILLQYGVAGLLTVLCGYSYIIYKSVKEKRYWAFWIIFVVLFHAITEPRLMNFAFNPFLLITFSCAYSIPKKTKLPFGKVLNRRVERRMLSS